MTLILFYELFINATVIFILAHVKYFSEQVDDDRQIVS